MTGHEENLMLKEQLRNSKKLLAEKEKVIREKEIQIENLTQTLLHVRKKMFGASSEVSRQTDGQMSLFDDMEGLTEKLLEAQTAVTVKEHKRTPRKAGVRAEMLEGLPKEIEEYIINPDETCAKCGAPLKVTWREAVHTEVEYQQAKLIVKQIVRQVAKCTKCGTE